MNAALKYGIVSEYKPGYAKVYFEEDGIVSDFWPILQRTSMVDKESWILNIKEHVVCLCDDHAEDGVVLGAIYNETDTPDSGAGAGKFRKVFEDGNYFEYDKAAHRLTASIQGMNVEIDGKFNVQKGADNLKDAITLIIEAVQPVVVIYGNNPVYAKLTQALTKINNLLK